MAKKTKKQAAQRGTKADVQRAERMVAAAPAGERKAVAGTGPSVPAHPEWAPSPDSKREQRTATFFHVVEVLLVLVPVAIVAAYVMAKGSFTAEGLQAYFAEDPAFLVAFLAACVQPFAAFLLRLVHQKYLEGDMGYAAGNLIVLLCSEMLLQNYVALAGMALLLWRVWRNAAPHMGEWAHERRLGGILFDVSGALVVFAFAAICAFATARLAA